MQLLGRLQCVCVCVCVCVRVMLIYCHLVLVMGPTFTFGRKKTLFTWQFYVIVLCCWAACIVFECAWARARVCVYRGYVNMQSSSSLCHCSCIKDVLPRHWNTPYRNSYLTHTTISSTAVIHTQLWTKWNVQVGQRKAPQLKLVHEPVGN